MKLFVLLPLLTLSHHLNAETIVPFEEDFEFIAPGDPYYTGWDDANWEPGLPGPASDVFLAPVSDEFGQEFELYVELQSSVTIANFEMDFGVDLTTSNNTFTVTGSTTGFGFISVNGNGKATLGTLNGFDSATGNLTAQSPAYLVDSAFTPGTAILEFRNADIRINGAGFNLFGPNSIVRDQNTGLNAFRNLERNESFFVLAAGYTLSVPGNFTTANGASIFLAANPSPIAPVLNVAGNLINDGVIQMNGNTVLNVSGGYSGTGTIELSGSNNQISCAGAFALGSVTREISPEETVTFQSDVTNTGDLNAQGNGGLYDISGSFTQTGGNLNTGISETDTFVLRAMTQFYDGGASVTGNGRLETTGGITAANGRIFPGLSPGRLTMTGNFNFLAPSILGIEIGGRNPGTEYDVLAQSTGDTGITLGGSLELTIIDDFDCELTNSDTFEVVTSDLPIQGSFSNVVSGARLATTDGLGSFLVSYGPGSSSPNTVTLSDFVANPVAQISFTDWALAESLPAGNDGPFDDANGNGIANVFEYLGGSARGVSLKLDVSPTDGSISASAGFAKFADNEFAVTLEQSTDLSPASWTVVENFNLSGTTASKNIRSVTLPGGNPRAFLRLRIDEAPE